MTRNAQIADLQQKVLVADSESRLKQRIDGLQSIIEAKCAVKVLMAEVRQPTTQTSPAAGWSACGWFSGQLLVFFHGLQVVSAKTASARLESEVKQERGTSQDLRKMLADERNVMSTMDMEHQQQLVELEQRHQEKVPILFTIPPHVTAGCGLKSFC